MLEGVSFKLNFTFLHHIDKKIAIKTIAIAISIIFTVAAICFSPDLLIKAFHIVHVFYLDYFLVGTVLLYGVASLALKVCLYFKSQHLDDIEKDLDKLHEDIEKLKVFMAKVAKDIKIYDQILSQSPCERVRKINNILSIFETKNFDISSRVNPDWVCPILKRIISDPILAPDGHYYERKALQDWYDLGHRHVLLNHHLLLPDPLSLPSASEMQIQIIERLKEIAYDNEINIE